MNNDTFAAVALLAKFFQDSPFEIGTLDVFPTEGGFGFNLQIGISSHNLLAAQQTLTQISQQSGIGLAITAAQETVPGYVQAQVSNSRVLSLDEIDHEVAAEFDGQPIHGVMTGDQFMQHLKEKITTADGPIAIMTGDMIAELELDDTDTPNMDVPATPVVVTRPAPKITRKNVKGEKQVDGEIKQALRQPAEVQAERVAAPKSMTPEQIAKIFNRTLPVHEEEME